MLQLPIFPRFHRALGGLAPLLAAALVWPITTLPAATTGFNETGAGPFDYDLVDNWANATINGIWDSSLALTAAQTVYFDSDYNLGTGLSFSYTGNFGLTLKGDGVADRTITLGGDILVAPGSNQTVSLGSIVVNEGLNLDLGGAARLFTVNGSKTLNVHNAVSNGAITKAGSGTMNLNGSNTFAGKLTQTAGTLSVNDSNSFSAGLEVSGGTMNINAAQTYTGGTVVTGGVLNVGASGTLGSNVVGNNVSVTGAILNLAATSNLGANQQLSVGSTDTAVGVLGLTQDIGLPAFTQVGAAPVVVAVNTSGYASVLNLATIGDGGNFLGSSSGGTYSGATLGVGNGNIYRLGGGGNTLTISTGVLNGANGLLVGVNGATNGAGTVSLTAANSLSGATQVAAGTLNLAGAGSLLNSNITVTSATLTFSNLAGNSGITRAPSVTLRAGTLGVSGNTGLRTNDVISGSLVSSGAIGGYNIVSLSSNAGNNVALTANALTQVDHGVTLFRGVGLGTSSNLAPSASSTSVYFTTDLTPSLIGGGGAAGSTNISILPYAVGDISTSNSGNTFVTYSEEFGIRPLNTATEFATSIVDGTTSTNNVRLLGSGTIATVDSATTINSLIVQNTSSGNATLAGTGTISVTSGQVILNPANTSTNTTINAGLAFGNRTGVFGMTTNRQVTIAGGVSGTAGLVIYNLTTGNGTSGGLTASGTAHSFEGDVHVLGRLVVNSGSNFLPSGDRTGDLHIRQNGRVNLGTGAAFTINGLNGSGNLSWGSSTNPGALTFGDNNANGTYTGRMNINNNGTGAIIKIGSGTQSLFGTSIHKGATIVQGGVLEVNTILNGGNGDNATNESSIGTSSNTSANLRLNGGTLRYVGATTSSDRLFQIGETTTGATGTLDASGTGTLTFTNAGNIGYGTVGSTGTAQTRTLVLTGTNTGLNTISAAINNNGAAVNGNSAVSLVKNGAGTWRLAGAAHGMTGGVTINQGVLIIDGTMASGVQVNAGTLGGSGSAASVTIGNGAGSGDAFLSAGNSAGTFSTSGLLSFASDGVFNWEFDSSTSQFDLVVANGIFLAGGAQMQFTDLAPEPVALALNTQFTIMDNTSLGAIDGTFAGLGEGATFSVGANTFQASYVGGTGNDLTLTVVVPEPTAANLALLALATATLFSRSRPGRR